MWTEVLVHTRHSAKFPALCAPRHYGWGSDGRDSDFLVPFAALSPETTAFGATDRGSQAGQTVSPPAVDVPSPCTAGQRPRRAHFPSMPLHGHEMSELPHIPMSEPQLPV